jgi:hypothetical protein
MAAAMAAEKMAAEKMAAAKMTARRIADEDAFLDPLTAGNRVDRLLDAARDSFNGPRQAQQRAVPCRWS